MMKVLEIIKLYFFLAVFLFIFYKFIVLSSISLYMFILFLLVGVLFDKRFILSRKLISVLLIVIHLSLYKLGLMESELLFIKELFWFSLVLLVGFVWHVLILNWLFILCEYIKWDYGCYIISRFSLLTSLMWLLWIDELIILKINRKFDNILANYYNKPKYKLGDLGKTFNFMWFNEYDKCYCLALIFLFLFYSILYLSIIFQNYTKMLMKGLGFKLKLWNIPWWGYLFFILTLLLSVELMTPRIYIVWIVLLVWNVWLMIKEIIRSFKIYNINYFINYKENKLNKHSCLDNAVNSYFTSVVIDPIRGVLSDKYCKWRYQGRRNFLKHEDTLTKSWLEFYAYGLVKDYITVSRVYPWYLSSLILEGDDIIEVIFEYSKERYEKIAARISLNDSVKHKFFVYDICEKEDIYEDIESAKHSLLIDKDVDISKVVKYYIILLKRDLIIRKEFYKDSRKLWLKEDWWLEEVGDINKKIKHDGENKKSS